MLFQKLTTHTDSKLLLSRFQRSLLQYITFHCIEEVAAVHIREILFDCFAHIWYSTPFNSHSCQKKALWTLALGSALLNGLKLHSFLITTTDSWLYLICLTVDNLILYLCLCWLTDICCCHSAVFAWERSDYWSSYWYSFHLYRRLDSGS